MLVQINIFDSIFIFCARFLSWHFPSKGRYFHSALFQSCYSNLLTWKLHQMSGFVYWFLWIISIVLTLIFNVFIRPRFKWNLQKLIKTTCVYSAVIGYDSILLQTLKKSEFFFKIFGLMSGKIRHGIFHKPSASVKFWQKCFHKSSGIFDILCITNYAWFWTFLAWQCGKFKLYLPYCGKHP